MAISATSGGVAAAAATTATTAVRVAVGSLASATRRERPALAPELIERLQPLNLSGQRVLPVPDALTSLFPWGGIQKGTSLAVGGSGAWSLAMAIMAKSLGSEGWLALVGAPDVGLVAAAEYGVRLDRVLVVETPPLHQWPTVVASLLEAVDVVAIIPDGRVGPRDARRLQARTREQGSVLLHLDGATTWPTVVDLTLGVTSSQWDGLGWGHGCLQSRRATVVSTGRRSAAKQTTAEVWLPASDGTLRIIEDGTVENRALGGRAEEASAASTPLPVLA